MNTGRNRISIAANNIVTITIFVSSILSAAVFGILFGTIIASFFIPDASIVVALTVSAKIIICVIVAGISFGLVSAMNGELHPIWERGSLLNTVETFEAWLHSKNWSIK